MKRFGNSLFVASLAFLATGCSNESALNSNLNELISSKSPDGLLDSSSMADDDELTLRGFPKIPFANAFVVASGRGQILAADRCGNQIGAGSNYTEGSTRLSGKCNNGGRPIRIASDPKGVPHLVFETDGSAKKPTDLSEQDRAELAYSPYIPFGKTIGINFEFQIPSNSARNTVAYSAIQFWQCASSSVFPPFAVMQVDHDDNRRAEKKGMPLSAMRAVNFITRHYKGGLNGQVVNKSEFPENAWQDVKIIANIDPTNKGRFQVWFNNALVGDYKGPIATQDSKICSNRSYRVKFGIYKGNEPGKKFKLLYRNFRMSDKVNFQNGVVVVDPPVTAPVAAPAAAPTAAPTAAPVAAPKAAPKAAQMPAPDQTPTARCLVTGGAGKVLFDNQRKRDNCSSICAEYSASNPSRTCKWNGVKFL